MLYYVSQYTDTIKKIKESEEIIKHRLFKWDADILYKNTIEN